MASAANAEPQKNLLFITGSFSCPAYAGYPCGRGERQFLALAAQRSVAGEATDSSDTQAEADARVSWLVNWAHTNKFDPVSVTFTYP